MSEDKPAARSAAEAGWHVSRYNVSAALPDSDKTVIVNLLKGSCAAYGIMDLLLMDALDAVPEDHPAIKRFASRGLIVNFDELEALKVMGRISNTGGRRVALTICPTLGCNFDCPYCFENHQAGKMSEEVQDQVVALAERMMDASGAMFLSISWYGGEPLIAPDVIESLSGRLIELAEKKNARYEAGIITNGYLLTQEIADMLERCKVTRAQVTLDGLGAAHDATRHLAGGGGTFDRIVHNLEALKLPFRVNIRHNVHEENKDQVYPLKEFVEKLAERSGNRITYYPAVVSGNDASDEREGGMKLLCGADSGEIGMQVDAHMPRMGRAGFCMASCLYSVGIDEQGRLHKCWEDVDKPEHSFGTAKDWNPLNPVYSAEKPDMFTKYMSTAVPVYDGECMECRWLPLCAGGCPNKRLFYRRNCLAYRDKPEEYVLTLYEIQKKKHEKRKENQTNPKEETSNEVC